MIYFYWYKENVFIAINSLNRCMVQQCEEIILGHHHLSIFFSDVFHCNKQNKLSLNYFIPFFDAMTFVNKYGSQYIFRCTIKIVL